MAIRVEQTHLYELRNSRGESLRAIPKAHPGVWAPSYVFSNEGEPVRYHSQEGAEMGKGMYGGEIVPVPAPTLNGGW